MYVRSACLLATLTANHCQYSQDSQAKGQAEGKVRGPNSESAV